MSPDSPPASIDSSLTSRNPGTLTWNAYVVFAFLDRRARTSSVSLTAALERTTPFNRNLLFSFKKFALARPLHRSGKPAAKETK